jgi:polyisoprenoid-binding protein YceI
MASPEQANGPALRELLSGAKLAGTWTLDASRSTIGLRSKSVWGLAPVKGVFHEVAGAGSVTAAGEVTGAITVAAGSIDTKNKKRDTHLRSAEFFDVENHPGIVVTVTEIKPASAGVSVTGSLTVRDRSKPVSFDAAVSTVDVGEVWLDAELEVNRGDFGLRWNQLGMASMNNTITVHAVFTRQ